MTEKFVSCASAFTSGDVEMFSQKYCVGTNGEAPVLSQNQSTKNDAQWNVNDQCLQGSAGPLCAVCGDEYVKVGENCVPCPGGANYMAPAMTLLCQCFVLFLIAFILIYRTQGHHKKKDISSTKTEIKILVSWLQILSVISQTFDSVKWTPGFTSVSQSTNIVNLDVTALFGNIPAACTMAIPFMSKFAVSASAPIGFTLAIKFGELLAIMLTSKKRRKTSTLTTPKKEVTKPGKKKKLNKNSTLIVAKTEKEKVQSQRSKANKIILLVMMLLYPSIANKAFLMFRCRTVDGLFMDDEGTDLKLILDKDYSVECFVGTHAQYLWVAYAAILVYAMGVPLILFFLLWNMRHHLHEKNVSEKNHHHHLEVKSRLGQFFMQCKCADDVIVGFYVHSIYP